MTDSAQTGHSEAEVAAWTAAARVISENAADGEVERDAANAAATIMSGSGFLDAPQAILEMFAQLIGAGYARALRDVRDGRYDADIAAWRR